MQWYEAEVRDLTARLAARPISCPVVFYGSSTIRLWTNLAADLHDDRIVNAGFGGSTLEACLYFFDRIVVPLHPASLVLYAGDNDLGDGRSPAQVLDWFRQIAGKVEKQLGPIPFSFIGIKPSPARFPIVEKIRAANELIQAEIAQHPNAFYIPFFDAMLRDGQPRPELFEPDGLHLDQPGYAYLTEVLNAYRNQIFNLHSPGCNP